MFSSMIRPANGVAIALVAIGLACSFGAVNHGDSPESAPNSATVPTPPQQSDQQVKKELDANVVRFVGEVLSGTEYGKDKIAVRWNKGPRLSTFGESSHHPTLVKAVVQDLNSALPDQYKIELLEKEDESATLKVWFVPFDELPDFAKEKKLVYHAPNLGFFNVRWNGRFEIVTADVLIGEDKLKGDRLRHFLLEEITQSLGFGGDSARFSESVFFENKRQRSYGSANHLSKLDRKLIKFHYNHVTPGSHPIELGILMTKHWDK